MLRQDKGFEAIVEQFLSLVQKGGGASLFEEQYTSSLITVKAARQVM
jgi:hypothetical protein